ncbi:dihydropteroate synthase [Alteromonas lipolytica]|uniref:Dihydropteroate synthase n=1 Tax=Alteromonas lipolytica TaxID=1856405 RepID=A0A1E8FGI0_9ALTE|nr:dihydropteroate synthase [Alteromonas lipolytica]OFI35040.1 dihydropteroate synthase [Alteromonas lipolytica]GGF56128.1 dihydropteroate synthase [Alteromonas lipolytica]
MQIRSITLTKTQPQVMGILNVTPDSFSDGGRHNTLQAALKQAREMEQAGATIIDIGGESTRPGAPDVSLEEEIARVVPVVAALRAQSDVVISVDTSKAEVMRESLAVGADLINDVRALQEPGCKEVVAEYGAPVCLMHMQGQPRTMQAAPEYANLFGEVDQFFNEQIAACEAAGISRDKILLDPGFGFGKTLTHNYQLLHELERFHRFDMPLLVGMSRKSMIGNLTGQPVEKRLAGSLAVATIAAMKGAQIIRVHDVGETADVVKVVSYMNTL